jgi:hypothetical protein
MLLLIDVVLLAFACGGESLEVLVLPCVSECVSLRFEPMGLSGMNPEGGEDLLSMMLRCRVPKSYPLSGLVFVLFRVRFVVNTRPSATVPILRYLQVSSKVQPPSDFSQLFDLQNAYLSDSGFSVPTGMQSAAVQVLQLGLAAKFVLVLASSRSDSSCSPFVAESSRSDRLVASNNVKNCL